MNEKIKELMSPQLKEWGADLGDNFSEELEKFAELIVKECLEVCNRATDIRYYVPPTQQRVVLDCMGEIKEHFGIKG